MKTFKYWLAALMVVSTIAKAQDAKPHLRDFTPKYTIETFEIKGESTSLKRRVVNILQIAGIKSAYWDEGSYAIIVQYDSKVIQLSAIKNFFFKNQSLVTVNQGQKRLRKPMIDCCVIGNYSITSK